MSVSSALVIRDPWIGLILNGRKTWEMRSRPTKVRGPIGLIRQGTGLVLGVAKLTGSGRPLTRQDYGAHRDRHAIPDSELEHILANGWVYPWILSDVRRLEHPVPYEHRSGAVRFVTLDKSVIVAIYQQLEAQGELPAVAQRVSAETEAPLLRATPANASPATASQGRDEQIFAYRPERAQAFGRPLPDGGFVVLAGSTAMSRGSASVKRDKVDRDDLVRSGILVPHIDPRLYRFAKDHRFSSASKAAGVVKDGNASGPSLWKNEHTGRTLKGYLEPA